MRYKKNDVEAAFSGDKVTQRILPSPFPIILTLFSFLGITKVQTYF